jgi:PrcB C-terminal
MKPALAVLVPGLALALAGCAGASRVFSSYAQIQVREVARSLYCNTPAEASQAVLLPEPQAVLDWQAARGIALAGSESLAQAPHAIVEMGLRPTGGYSLAVARAAVLRGERVVLQATFFTPAPGSMRTQAVSTPCVLVQLPAGRYSEVEVQDPTGHVVASGGLPPPPAEPAQAPAQ